jgi:hypothetical protein
MLALPSSGPRYRWENREYSSQFSGNSDTGVQCRNAEGVEVRNCLITWCVGSRET